MILFSNAWGKNQAGFFVQNPVEATRRCLAAKARMAWIGDSSRGCHFRVGGLWYIFHPKLGLSKVV